MIITFILGLIMSGISLYEMIDLVIRTSKENPQHVGVALPVLFTSFVSTAVCVMCFIISIRLGG